MGADHQHNMWVINAKAAVLSIITGGGKWLEIAIAADSLYQHLLLTAEKKFWRCVENGEPPRQFGIEPPRPRIKAVHIVDMSASNAWAEFSGVFRRTREAYLEHENCVVTATSCARSQSQRRVHRPDLSDPSPRASSFWRRVRVVAEAQHRPSSSRAQALAAHAGGWRTRPN
jgi:hypothetical protein